MIIIYFIGSVTVILHAEIFFILCVHILCCFAQNIQIKTINSCRYTSIFRNFIFTLRLLGFNKGDRFSCKFLWPLFGKEIYKVNFTRMGLRARYFILVKISVTNNFKSQINSDEYSRFNQLFWRGLEYLQKNNTFDSRLSKNVARFFYIWDFFWQVSKTVWKVLQK